MRVPLLFLVVAVAALTAGFGGGEGAGGRPDVVATTTEAADLARHVAGDRADVHGLLAPNSDPHEYEPRPGDIRALAGADLVVRSGGDVDAWLSGAVDSAGSGAPSGRSGRSPPRAPPPTPTARPATSAARPPTATGCASSTRPLRAASARSRRSGASS